MRETHFEFKVSQSPGLDGANCHVIEKAMWWGIGGSLQGLRAVQADSQQGSRNLGPTTTPNRMLAKTSISFQEDPEL